MKGVLAWGSVAAIGQKKTALGNRTMRICHYSILILIATSAALSTAAEESRQSENRSTAGVSYQLAPDFPQLQSKIALEAASAVATDSKGEILVFHRGENPILRFDVNGKLLHSFGKGMFDSAHGLRVDANDNIWVTDNANHTVMKLSREGHILMTLGKKNEPGEDASHFNKPADIAFSANGDFYVADGYGNSRIVKFDQAGKFLMAWGKKGTGPGEFNLPHTVQVDAEGSLYVGDRENNRIQVFDADGKFIRQIERIAPFGLFITPDQLLFVADGRANKVTKMRLDGSILTSWGTTGDEPGNFRMAHGLTVARDGAVYVTEITGKRVQKFVAKAKDD